MQKNQLAPPPQLAVIVDSMHPRVVYALETVMGDFLGIELSVLEVSDLTSIASWKEQGKAICTYLDAPLETGLPALPCNGLLYESDIRPACETIEWKDRSRRVGLLLDEDLLALVFFHLSQYSHLQPGANIAYDAHGRYPDPEGGLVVHDQLEAIRNALQPILSAPIPNRPFDFEITIDVDQPWKYLHKPWWVRWGGLAKDILRGGDWKERWDVMTGKRPDPFSVLSEVQAICPAEKTKVFFLAGGSHPNDSRYDLRMAPYRRLVQDWQAAGFEIGIHPSYETWKDAGQMQAQKESLEAVAGPVTISRQHYLRYRNPDTFRQLIALGIRRDYTLCRSTRPGPPTGVALPHRWFDLQRNAATDLELVPAMVMDRSLQLYQGLQPAAARSAIAKAIAQTKAARGKFVIILHNETFGESGEWKGWLPVIRETVKLLKG